LNRLRGDRFEKFINVAPDLALETVYALYADDAGALWIGTADHGLVRHKDGKFTRYSSKDGLFDNSIFRILEDDEQNLWMTCDHGIFKVSKAQLNAFAEGRITNLTSTVFGKADGLLSTECSGSIQPAGWKGNDGRLWFPTSKGAAVIDPRNGVTNQVGPPVLVESILVDGTEMPFSTNVVVAPGGEQVQINYTALSFVAPLQVKFKCQLAGLDHDWLDVGTRRVAYYPHLPPGHYHFKVIACNNDGVWNQTGATLGLTMQPFFWQTGTFRVSLALSALMATGLLVWRITLTRHRRQLAALERQHALELERTRIARDMHDGVGASLVKISLLGEIVEGQLTGPNQSRDQVHKMTVAARDAVRDMDEIVWAVNPKNDTLENLANYICQFAREHFTDTAIQCRLDVPVELPPMPLTAEVRHNLFLAIKEALNNVLKHARASQVRLEMELNGSVLRILIEDDGRGCLPDEVDRFGNGLENMRRRLTDIGGRLEWTTQPGKGTAVRMILRLDGLSSEPAVS
jgi:signal transduction histidine kinase